MASKSSHGVLYYFVWIIIFLAFAAAFYFGYLLLMEHERTTQLRLINSSLTSTNLLTMQENLMLERENHAQKAKDFRKTAIIVASIVAVALLIGWIVTMIIKSRADRIGRALTIDEAKKKGYKLIENIMGKKALWCRADSVERRLGDTKLYFLVYGFSPMIEAGPVMWSRTKIIGVLNDDWEHGRIENIPQGYSLLQAVQKLHHEFDLLGYPVQRDKEFAEIEKVVELAKKKQAEKGLMEDLGVEPSAGGG